MTKKMRNEILKSATFVSGLLGLASSDLNKTGRELPMEKWDDALKIEETPKGIRVSIGIIVDAEVRAKAVTYEIISSIKALLKKNNIKLDNILVYIRGAK